MKSEFSVHQEIRKYAPLLILPVIFSVFLYAFVHNFTQERLKTEVEQTLDLFYMQMSAMTRETEGIGESLSSDFTMLLNHPDVVSLSYSFSNPYSVCTQIEIRKSDSPCIDHIYFVYDSEDAIYSDYGYYTYSSLSGILSGLNLSVEEFCSIDRPHWEMSTVGMLREPFYVMPFRDEDGNIVGRFLFTISLDQLVDIISTLDAEYACLYGEDFLIVSKPLDTYFTIDDLSTDAGVSALLGKRVKCFYVEKGDYTYMAAFDAISYYAPLFWMIFGFVVYILLVFVIDYLYLFKVSKARYEEITTLINSLPQENEEESHSYGELLPVVQKALLSAADLREQQNEITENHVIHNILCRYYNQSLLQKYAGQVGIPTSGVTYCLSHFSIREWDNIALSMSSPKDSHNMVWTIFKTAAGQFENGNVRIFCDDGTDSFNALFCGNASDGFSAYVESASESICKFMRDEYGIFAHASVSSLSENIAEIPDLLSQAQKLESFSISINSSSPIISERLLKENSESFTLGNFFRQEMALSSMILAKKYDVIPATVAAILDEHVTNNPDYDLAMDRLKTISSSLAEGLLTIKGVDLDLEFYAKRLREANSVSALNADVEFVFRELSLAVSTSPTTYKEVDEACAYIKENLDDKNLNVTMISEAVSTIPQRLTPLFQKQLNMGIAEYVNYQRIEKATELLTTSKLKVTQISDMVGYCNTDTFTRNFRKLKGVTPTEYRQMST